MEKRKITAREIAKDIKAGLSDPELMERYSLSAQALQSVFEKLIRAAVLTRQEIERRVPFAERTVDIGLFVCPACGNIQGREFSTCPRCGFEVPDRSRLAREPAAPVSGPIEITPGVTYPVEIESIPPVVEKRKSPDEPVIHITDPGELTKISFYCRLLAVASFLGYVCVLGIFIYFIQLGPSLQKDLSPNQFLLAVSLFGIPALINAFLILVVLRAVSESLNLISVLARNLKKK